MDAEAVVLCCDDDGLSDGVVLWCNYYKGGLSDGVVLPTQKAWCPAPVCPAAGGR